MNTNEQIRECQLRILGCLEEWERSVAALYDLYAAKLPAMERFWMELANEERGHARMLETLKKQLDAGHVFWNIGRFREDAVRCEIEEIAAALKRANERPPSAHEALNTAAKLETCLIESKFYSVVSSTAPEFERIATTLASATQCHIAKLRDEMMSHRADWPRT